MDLFYFFSPHHTSYEHYHPCGGEESEIEQIRDKLNIKNLTGAPRVTSNTAVTLNPVNDKTTGLVQKQLNE